MLNGTLPSWLFRASSLKDIDIRDNQLSGHIKEFQSKSLESLDVHNNQLQGPIPSSISLNLNLTTIYMSSNNLSGVVEFGIYFAKLQKLESLDLSYNHLSVDFNGTDEGTFPNLRYLELASCNVSEFPQFLRGSRGLALLDLSNNRIQGRFPDWMWDAWKDSLFYLNLSYNSLTNFERLSWNNINLLDLSSNLIRGNLPIPTWKTNAFFLSNNSFSGEISSLICNATSLQFLDLSHNNLSGVIPQCLGNLSPSLSFLSLGRNRFQGLLAPQTFPESCQLKNLGLNGNQLQGPLPPSIKNCTSLEVLDVGNNKFNDTFPHWLGDLPQLQVLVLRSNQLHGSIHDTTRFGPSFSTLQIFDVSNNYFVGPHPVRYIESFKAMINLTKDHESSSMTYMGMQDYLSQFYSYSIAIEMKGQEVELTRIFTLLATLDLSNNKFEGEIPTVMGKLRWLKGLNLSHNNIGGGIPSSLGNLVNLEWLDLSSNKLIGTIPQQLVGVTSLSILNVSRNQLHGQIPQGKQFSTFGNDSYQGNKGLCGFPVSKGCNNNEPPPPPSNSLEEDDDDGSNSIFAFGWKVVAIGYGCGVVFGLGVGFVVFQTGKPNWVVNLVEDMHLNHKIRRNKFKTRRSRGRN